MLQYGELLKIFELLPPVTIKSSILYLSKDWYFTYNHLLKETMDKVDLLKILVKECNSYDNCVYTLHIFGYDDNFINRYLIIYAGEVGNLPLFNDLYQKNYLNNYFKENVLYKDIMRLKFMNCLKLLHN